MQEKVFIKNKKGLRIASVIHRPEKKGKYPTIVLLHGFRGYKEEVQIVMLANELEQNGFVVVRFDTSGYGESEGTTEYDYRLSNFYSDTESVFKYLQTQSYVDLDKLGLFGHSLGGTLAIVFASQNPWLKAVCVVSPPTESARKDNHERIKLWEESGWYEKETTQFGLKKFPFEFVIDSKKYNALHFIDKVTMPILFILGTADKQVTPRNTKEIFELANSPKELIEIEGMNHHYQKVPEQLAKINVNVVDFFKKNIMLCRLSEK